MRQATYLRLELVRAFRNRRFFTFSLGFPVLLYYLIASPNRNEHDLGGSGISAPLYYMVGLAAFGTMSAVLSTGARIANERTVGWTRQLRVTPLSTRWYFGAKIATAYLMAGTTMLAMFIAGATLGVRLPASRWLEMFVLLVIGLVPFTAIGVLLGHLITSDSIGPVIGGFTALLAFLGGTWFPLGDGALRDIGESLPSYWLVQASHIALGGGAWSGLGWLVVGLWTLIAVLLARWAYRRDTQRV
jgi:ABC-2 type transport system permease protein